MRKKMKISIMFIFIMISNSLYAVTQSKIVLLSLLNVFYPFTFLPSTYGLSNCTENQNLFELELNTDPWGDEIEWDLVSNNGEMVASEGNVDKGERALEINAHYSRQYCLDPGNYTFTIKDGYGDGLADCSSYECGSYKVFFDGEEIASGEGNDFKYTVSHSFSSNVSIKLGPPIITARGGNPQKKEGVYKAFDGKLNTKWLDFSPNTWVKYQFANNREVVINKYRITSGNDFSSRDPKDWNLIASNDGKKWFLLDKQRNVKFTQRYETKEFDFNNKKLFNMYKLVFTKNNGAPITQMAEIEFIERVETDSISNKPKNLKIVIKSDKFSSETSWTLKKLPSGKIIHSVPRNSYNKHQMSQNVFTLDPNSTYRFTINDSFGDGNCCSYGQGFYKIYLDDKEVLSSFNEARWFKERSHLITTMTPSMSARDSEWLNAHNKRRKDWHQKYGKSYVPLKWSEGLKNDAQKYANQLKETCDQPLKHAKGIDQGENLARNQGSGTWGQQPAVENILKRFVENEQTWGWPKNGHLTQVLWRATKYVGCAESVKNLGNGKFCHTQVCRYSKSGNCNMGSGNEWIERVMQDKSTCGNPCPPEGCF